MTERRYDPVAGEWRTIAAHRQDRTFLPGGGACPLCPATADGADVEIIGGDYGIACFDNRFPTLSAAPPPPSVTGTDLHPVAPAVGAAEVVVWSPDHGRTLADLPVDHLQRLLDVWADRYAELGARPEVAYVLAFENKGEVVGVTLEHPHGQVYAYPEIPPLVQRRLDAGRRHLVERGTCVVCEVGGAEHQDGRRVVAEDLSTVGYVPFAPRFPYEVRIQPKRHATSLLDLSDPERASLAGVLHQVLAAYDRLFGFSLPYVLAVHQAPTDDPSWLDVSHLYIELLPPHRTATKLKFLAGSELTAGAFVGDVAPEVAAASLRA